MINYLVEITFLIYGFYLLNQSQYLTCLILLILSLILFIKGFKYKESIIITIIILLFLTQYHIYFPYRETQNNNNNQNNSYEGFKDNKTILEIDEKEIKDDKEIRKENEERELKEKEKKERRKKRKQEKLLEIEERKTYANYPTKYRKNIRKINTKSKNWGDSLYKWKYLKENLFIILNS